MGLHRQQLAPHGTTFMRGLPLAVPLLLAAQLSGCSSSTPTTAETSGGASSAGGTPAASPTGGASGSPTQPSSGGASSGGAPSSLGGSSAGGSDASSGASSGGSAAGGSPSAGGASSGGSSAGGSAAGGAAGIAGSAGAASCAGLFCEDFESGKIDPAIWDTKTFGGQTVAVESTQVAHGKYAVQFHAAPNIVSYDFIITKNAPAALKGHHFGRASFYLTKPPAQHTVYLFSGSSGFPNFKYLEVAGTGNTWQLSLVHLFVADGKATSSSNTEEAYKPGGTVPQDKWTCIEWEFNDTPDTATVYVAGKQDVTGSLALSGGGTGQVGGFTDFGFGFYAWHPATYAFDVYYDDIVLDTKRVGCPP